jgi:hypothetical protein
VTEPVAWVRATNATRTVPMSVGAALTFGRSPDRPVAKPVDLTVSDSRRVSRQAGALEATRFGLVLTNTGSNPLLLDEPGQPRRSVRPGQVHLLGLGLVRIGFAGTEDGLEVDVRLGAAAAPPEDDQDGPTAERTRPAWTLGEGTAYFACLVALCEPTLRQPDSPWIPTSQQIADRLYAAGLLPERRSGDWVDRRLDDVRAKLPIGERQWTAERARRAGPDEMEQALARERSGAPRRSGRKEQLVDFAVGNGIVTMSIVHRMLG